MKPQLFRPHLHMESLVDPIQIFGIEFSEPDYSVCIAMSENQWNYAASDSVINCRQIDLLFFILKDNVKLLFVEKQLYPCSICKSASVSGRGSWNWLAVTWSQHMFSDLPTSGIHRWCSPRVATNLFLMFNLRGIVWAHASRIDCGSDK